MYYENEVRLVGCLGRDPEFRSFNNGGRVANLRLATTRTWKDRNSGERKDATEWHSVAVTSDHLVGIVEKYTRKGSYLSISGRLATRKWQDQSGADRYTTEIVVGGFDGKIGLLDRGGQGNEQSDGYGGGSSGNQGGSNHDMDDEIPF